MKKQLYHALKAFSALTLFSLTFSSCKKLDKNGVNRIEFSTFPTEEKISFQNLFEFKAGTAYKIYSVDSTLILFNVHGEKDFFFYNYSIKNKSLSKGFLKYGRGPGEVLGAFSTGINSKTLWVYDITLKKVIAFDRNKVLLQEKNPAFQEYPIDNSFYQIDLKDDLTFLSVGNIQSKHKIQHIDLKSSKTISEYGTFDNIPNDIPFTTYKSMQDGFLFTRPSGDKTVFFNLYTDKVEIFNSKKQVISQTIGPEGFEADMDVYDRDQQSRAAVNTKTRFAFLNGAVTQKFIYLLYSGNLYHSEFLDYGNEIFVYDWEGNPVKKLLLDRHINSFTVTADNNIIYASDPNTGYIIQTKK